MSSAAQTHRRNSWRGQQASSSGNRWISRLLLTLVALLLLAFFLYLLLKHRPKPVLKTILVQAGSYELGAIMPPMYASTSSDQIKDQLGAEEVTGLKAKIGNFFEGDARLDEYLADPDDTVLVIVRGYVLQDGNGQAVLACSDLSVDDLSVNDLSVNGDFSIDGAEDDIDLQGVIPIEKLFQRLCSDDTTPDSFEGSRIVLLDIEPLAVLPRLGQFGDDIFGSLADSIASLSGKGVDNLWVVATRGPLQNAGWDHQAKLPISTQSVLDAIRGEADFDENEHVYLDELCRYVGSRYNRITRSSSLPAPEVALFRGGQGRVGDLDDANAAWLAKIPPKPNVEPDDVDAAAEDEDAAADDRDSVSNDAAKATLVRFRAQDDQTNTQGDSEQGNSERGNGEQGSDAETKRSGGNPKPNEDSEGDPLDAESDGTNAPVTSTPVPDTFWDVRDRFEMMTFTQPSQHLHPIAVAPQLWRKLVQNVLHAEIESLDPLAPKTRSEFSASITADLQAIEQSLTANRPSPTATDDAREIPQQIQNLWQQVITDRRSRPNDRQVQAADQLQWAIAAGRMRQWSRRLYQHQSLICGGDSFAEVASLTQTLEKAERLLAEQTGSDVDTRTMIRVTQDIRDDLKSVDQTVAEKIEQLEKDFGRVDESTGWAVIRRAHAWLRSPIPSGPQRRELLELLNSLKLESPTKEVLSAGASSVQLSELAADRGLLAMTRQIESEYSVERERQGVASNDPSTFDQAFAAAVRSDPRDVRPDATVTPLVHQVVPIPRKRQLSVNFYDSSRQKIDEVIQMESNTGSVAIEISPEATRRTRFRITCYVDESAGEFDDPILETTWKKNADSRPDSNEQSVTVTVSPNKVGRAQLDLKVVGDAGPSITAVDMRFDIEVIDAGEDTEIRSLNGSREVSLELPQKDRIRVAVRTLGLSRKVISGEDNLPGGAWLRTFASRKTRFTLEMFNDSGRAAKALAWLVKLEHPFRDDGVDEYWPGVVEGQMKRLTSNVIGDDGRAYSSLLRSARVLKGPTEIDLKSGRARTPVSWLPPPDDNSDSAPGSAPLKVNSPADKGTNVTHGFALITRLIDESGRMLPGKDQVIWLIPMPWPAEAYVELNKVQFQQGEVQITADLRSELDGDDIDDMIPEIEKTPVTVQWTEDDQWGSFRMGRTAQPDSRPIELKYGLPNRGQIEVAVARGRETLVQLDVDGWPRAILRSIAQREGAVAKKRNRFEQLRFAGVEIGYGDSEPSNSVDDDPLGPLQVFAPDPDVPVIFRGRGKSLVTRLIADLTPVSFRRSPPPEIEVSEGSSRGARFWTDRSVKTFATELKDNGTMELLTTVKDLSVNWNSKAAKADADLRFRSKLNVEGESKIASMQVTLDSTPPEIDEFRRRSGRLYVGQKVQYNIAGSDPAGTAGGSSGLARVVIGLDNNEDGKPEKADKSYPFETGRLSKVFNAPDPGRHQIAVQIWDKAGLASKPRADVLSVYKVPKPKKKDPKPQPTPAPPSPSTSPAKPPKPKVAKRGPLEGRIDIGSTLRGTLTLSPIPDDKIRPKNGELSIGGSRPTFSFGNVPEGEYSLSFKGTMQGSSKTFTWEGLSIGKKHVLPAN